MAADDKGTEPSSHAWAKVNRVTSKEDSTQRNKASLKRLKNNHRRFSRRRASLRRIVFPSALLSFPPPPPLSLSLSSLAVSQNKARRDKLPSFSKARTTRRWMKTRGNGVEFLITFPRVNPFHDPETPSAENGESKARHVAVTSASASSLHIRKNLISRVFRWRDRVKGGKSTGDHPRFNSPRSVLRTAGRLSWGRGDGRRRVRRGGDRSKLKNV